MISIDVLLFLAFIGNLALFLTMPVNQEILKSISANDDSSERTPHDRVLVPIKLKTKIIYWTPQEDNLLKGVQQFGTNWKKIIKAFQFHPIRTIYSLQRKYRVFLFKHENPNCESKIKDIRIQSKNNLPQYCLWYQGRDWSYAKRHLPTWRASLEEFRKDLRDKCEIVRNEIDKLNKSSTSPNSNLSVSNILTFTELLQEKEYQQASSISKHVQYNSKLSSEKNAKNALEDMKKSRKYIPWTKDEIYSLEKGVNRFGFKWDKILKTYKFNECRAGLTLCSKYKQLSANKGYIPNSSFKTMDIIFKNDIKIPFYLYSDRRNNWLHHRDNIPNWKELLEEYRKELIKKLEIVSNEIEKLDNSVKPISISNTLVEDTRKDSLSSLPNKLLKQAEAIKNYLSLKVNTVITNNISNRPDVNINSISFSIPLNLQHENEPNISMLNKEVNNNLNTTDVLNSMVNIQNQSNTFENFDFNCISHQNENVVLQ